MSLYNALFGRNPFSGLLLTVLGTDETKVPRFRDCFLNKEGQIVIHTRTGGGNRDLYDSEEICRARNPDYFKEGAKAPSGPWNADLRALTGYLFDRDDDFDHTYADFVFEVPEAFKPQIALLLELGGVQNPAERWRQMLDDLRVGKTENTDPQREQAILRALAVGEAIFGELIRVMRAAESANADGAPEEEK